MFSLRQQIRDKECAPIVVGLNKISGTENRSLQRKSNCSSSFSGTGAADPSASGGSGSGGGV